LPAGLSLTGEDRRRRRARQAGDRASRNGAAAPMTVHPKGAELQSNLRAIGLCGSEATIKLCTTAAGAPRLALS